MEQARFFSLYVLICFMVPNCLPPLILFLHLDAPPGWWHLLPIGISDASHSALNQRVFALIVRHRPMSLLAEKVGAGPF